MKIGVRSWPMFESGVLVVVVLLTLLCAAPGLSFYLTSSDHGYQLSLGRQIVLGKFPFVDLFFHYGPLTAFTSALGLMIDDSLVPETILCALGYTMSLVLVYWLNRHYVGRIPALLTVAIGLVLLARFYKWYYWLFPLVMLVCVHRALNRPGPLQGHGLAGVVGGVAGLYRLDLGLACAALYLVPMLAMEPAANRMRRNAGRFALCWVLPMGLWFVILTERGGFLAILDYLNATVVQGVRYTSGISRPVPPFELRRPLSFESGVALTYAIFPVSYLTCLAAGLERVRRRPADREALMMTAVGAAGLAIFPQALHRADAYHLLQVLPPMLIAVPMLMRLAWRGRITFARVALVGYALLLMVSSLALRTAGAFDLDPVALFPSAKYRELKLGPAGSDHPLARLIAEAQRVTPQGRSVLIASNAPQFYFFASRPLSGVLNMYDRGWFDDHRWRKRNLEAVESAPPQLVLVEESAWSGSAASAFRRSQPELYQYLATHYTHIAGSGEGWLILTPAAH